MTRAPRILLFAGAVSALSGAVFPAGAEPSSPEFVEAAFLDETVCPAPRCLLRSSSVGLRLQGGMCITPEGVVWDFTDIVSVVDPVAGQRIVQVQLLWRMEPVSLARHEILWLEHRLRTIGVFDPTMQTPPIDSPGVVMDGTYVSLELDLDGRVHHRRYLQTYGEPAWAPQLSRDVSLVLAAAWERHLREIGLPNREEAYDLGRADGPECLQ